jgi:hypothetical protein
MRFSLSAILCASALSAACSSNGTVATGSDASVFDAGDAAVPDSGPKCATVGATADQCQACCETAFPGGYQLFAKLTLACACNPTFCGPPDSGVPEAGPAGDDDAGDAGNAASDAGEAGAGSGAPGDDAGLYGTAPCSAATCAYTEQPSDACNSCIFETLGNTAQPGTCGIPVLEACITDPNCYPFSQCVEECPP